MYCPAAREYEALLTTVLFLSQTLPGHEHKLPSGGVRDTAWDAVEAAARESELRFCIAAPAIPLALYLPPEQLRVRLRRCQWFYRTREIIRYMSRLSRRF